ncbi:MAG: rhodanese-like domain-containing protein [Planctomycetota bacterium]|nr:rhodanese-like domain-containing protein [Planctomycetota bacterium]
MKKTTSIAFIVLSICLSATGRLMADEPKSDVKKPVATKVTSGRAMEMLKADPQNTFLVDVRTRPEYQLIGHPRGACNIPFKFWTGKFNGEKGKYDLEPNTNFQKDLRARFNPKTDTLIFMCRSGKRSRPASAATLEAGWPAERIFNLDDGFEGGQVKDKNSIYNGQRRLKGWRFEGFPWTCDLDKKLLYKADLEAEKYSPGD